VGPLRAACRRQNAAAMIFENLIVRDRDMARRDAAAVRQTPSKEALPSDELSG